jgi:hypothetical protein
MLVYAQVEHSRIEVKYFLGAIAMVHIPIDNEDTRNTMGVDCASRTNCGVVEQAEPHSLGSVGMVTRRTNSAERIGYLALEYGIDC